MLLSVVGKGFLPPPLGSRWGKGAEAGGHSCIQHILMRHLASAAQCGHWGYSSE